MKTSKPRDRKQRVKKAVRRRPGGSKGRIRIAADFDVPLREDFLTAFTGRKR